MTFPGVGEQASEQTENKSVGSAKGTGRRDKEQYELEITVPRCDPQGKGGKQRKNCKTSWQENYKSRGEGSAWLKGPEKKKKKKGGERVGIGRYRSLLKIS